MIVRSVAALAIVILALPVSIQSFAQDNLHEFYLVVGQDTLTACGYRILRNTPDGDTVLMRFTFPTLSMLVQDRPSIVKDYTSDASQAGFRDIVSAVASEIMAGCVSEDGEIWVGFGFYEGEGSDGIGGIGYFDPRTGESGVLRHPALVDYSISDLKVTADTIYAVTKGFYEGASTVGNGLVAISRRTLHAIARVPPGTSTLWDTETQETVAPMYERPITDLISDQRFIPKVLPDWPATTEQVIKNAGAKAFMSLSQRQEQNTRQAALSRAVVISDESLRASGPDHVFGQLVFRSGIKFATDGFEELKQSCGVDGFKTIWIDISGNMGFPEWKGVVVYPQHQPSQWVRSSTYDKYSGKAGAAWLFETFDKSLFITLDSLVVKGAECRSQVSPTREQYFESTSIHVRYLRLKD